MEAQETLQNVEKALEEIRPFLMSDGGDIALLSIEDNSLFEDKKGEAETIAGFILELSGGFPRVGSEINFGNYVFTIEAIDKKRIKQIRLDLKTVMVF